MKLLISEIPFKTVSRIHEVIKTAKQQSTYLSSYYITYPVTNPGFLIGGIVYTFFLLLVNYWDLFYWVLISGPIIIYFLSRQLQCIWYWMEVGRDAMFFDNSYFISISGKTLQIFPLIEFKHSDIILAFNQRNYIVRFHFTNGTIYQPCRSKDDIKVQKFQTLLDEYTLTLKQSFSNTNYSNNFTQSFYQKTLIRKNPLIASIFVFVILWFTLPNIIDNNAFNLAKNTNSASAFRYYLSEPKNVKYTNDAKFNIKKIYNNYITKYKALRFSSTEGTEALIKVLEYMRDNDIYTVNMLFLTTSYLHDLYYEMTEYHVIPITPSFTLEKNKGRENDVIKTLQMSFGNIFPTDVFKIDGNSGNVSPKFEVHYSYKNDTESIYYNLEESDLPDNEKTYYYGIELVWKFRIILPLKSEAIYEFALKSQPAQQFTSEVLNSDMVYSNMALSAFNEFKNEFDKQFLIDQ